MMRLSIKHAEAMVPRPVPALDPPVEIWRDHAGAIYAYGEILGEECWMHVPGLASFRFTLFGDEIAAAITDGAEEELVQDAYRRRALPMPPPVRRPQILHPSPATP